MFSGSSSSDGDKRIGKIGLVDGNIVEVNWGDAYFYETTGIVFD